jgi:hypothetical protein
LSWSRLIWALSPFWSVSLSSINFLSAAMINSIYEFLADNVVFRFRVSFIKHYSMSLANLLTFSILDSVWVIKSVRIDTTLASVELFNAVSYYFSEFVKFFNLSISLFFSFLIDSSLNFRAFSPLD